MLAEKTPPANYHKGEGSDASDHDTESIRGPPQQTLHRKLKNRHIAMIRSVRTFFFVFLLLFSHPHKVSVVSSVQVFSSAQPILWQMVVQSVSCLVT